MKGFKILAVLLLIAAMLFAYGCERKIVNEVANGDDQSLAGCFGCHGEEALDGALIQAEGEWRNSVHASGSNVDYTNRGGTDCTRCHNHIGFVNYIEGNDLEPPFAAVSAIHCFTCHAPHERGDLSVRTEEAVTLRDGSVFDHGLANLCANCHMARTVGDDITDPFNITSTHWGPHYGPQGDMLNGTGGYEYAGANYSTSPHKTVVEDGCIGCHMGNIRVRDGYHVGGHSFNMVDEETGTDLSGLCDAAGCHDHKSPEDFNFLADADYDGDGVTEGVRDEIDDLAEDLHALCVAAGVLSAGGSPVPGEYEAGVAGAAFNYLLYEDDRSHGAHNEIYMRDLLQSSIDYMEAQAQAGQLVAIPSHD